MSCGKFDQQRLERDFPYMLDTLVLCLPRHLAYFKA
jgi:hypothetical protein